MPLPMGCGGLKPAGRGVEPATRGYGPLPRCKICPGFLPAPRSGQRPHMGPLLAATRGRGESRWTCAWGMGDIEAPHPGVQLDLACGSHERRAPTPPNPRFPAPHELCQLEQRGLQRRVAGTKGATGVSPLPAGRNWVPCSPPRCSLASRSHRTCGSFNCRPNSSFQFCEHGA